MLDVTVAREIVLRLAKSLTAETSALLPDVLGRVLAVDVVSDLDSPPFDKALMDGYAVRAEDLANGPVELHVIEEVQAGAMPSKAVGAGEATAVYTGAPLPFGIDAVVMKERCEVLPDGRVRANDPQLRPGKSVLLRGAEMRAGEVVLPAGTVITPVALGLLAAVGQTTASLFPRPMLSVLATGDELVEADQRPSGGQIRNSNGPLLMAQAARAGCQSHYLGIGRDDEASLTALITEGLTNSNILVLAGGVSAGKFDLVPAVLRKLGVEVHFHHVRMKPGKPLLFGTKGDVLVFGLPGNPVSAFVGFELFVRPAIQKLAGHQHPGPNVERLPLSQPLATSGDRPTYHPARIEIGNVVRPLPWLGSADLRALLLADALIVIPAGNFSVPAGTIVEVIRV